MSLTDIMSHLDLTVYPEVGLIIFFGVFVAVAARAMRTEPTTAQARAALPLDESDLTEQEASS